jgi:hypothetical protein
MASTLEGAAVDDPHLAVGELLAKLRQFRGDPSQARHFCVALRRQRLSDFVSGPPRRRTAGAGIDEGKIDGHKELQNNLPVVNFRLYYGSNWTILSDLVE